MSQLSAAQARRIALAAQGFLDPRHATPTMRTLLRTLGRTGVLQVDSVNVLARAHYMPLYSRMGPYDATLLSRAVEAEPRRLVEYWAHVQALMPVELWPQMQHRMASYRGKGGRQNAAPQVVGHHGHRGAHRQPARGDRRPGRVDGARPRRRVAEGQGALGVELVGDAPGARLPLHGG